MSATGSPYLSLTDIFWARHWHRHILEVDITQSLDGYSPQPQNPRLTDEQPAAVDYRRHFSIARAFADWAVQTICCLLPWERFRHTQVNPKTRRHMPARQKETRHTPDVSPVEPSSRTTPRH